MICVMAVLLFLSAGITGYFMLTPSIEEQLQTALEKGDYDMAEEMLIRLDEDSVSEFSQSLENERIISICLKSVFAKEMQVKDIKLFLIDDQRKVCVVWYKEKDANTDTYALFDIESDDIKLLGKCSTLISSEIEVNDTDEKVLCTRIHEYMSKGKLQENFNIERVYTANSINNFSKDENLLDKISENEKAVEEKKESDRLINEKEFLKKLEDAQAYIDLGVAGSYSGCIKNQELWAAAIKAGANVDEVFNQVQEEFEADEFIYNNVDIEIAMQQLKNPPSDKYQTEYSYLLDTYVAYEKLYELFMYPSGTYVNYVRDVSAAYDEYKTASDKLGVLI